MDSSSYRDDNGSPPLPNRSAKRPMLYRFPSSSSLINEQSAPLTDQNDCTSPPPPLSTSCPPADIYSRPLPRSSSPSPSFKALLAGKWRTATEVLHEGHIEEALRRTKDLLSSCEQEGYSHPSADLLTANVGILHWHLGELDAALEYIRRATGLTNARGGRAVMIWFVYGCVALEIGKMVESLHAFERCVQLFPREDSGVDCAEWGTWFMLERTMVEHNIVKVHERIDQSDRSVVVGIWRLPGGIVFEPLE